MIKKILQFFLKYLARGILRKYQPEVIGITGSVGKTTTKEAVAQVLQATGKRVRSSIKNYNNEIGVPLTIIGCSSGKSSFRKWFQVFGKALKLLIKKESSYPEVLILEMGIDRPGDMKYLQSIVQPTIGIVTAVGPTHLEFFESVEQIRDEKMCLVKKIPSKGSAILNYDQALIREKKEKIKSSVLTFGLHEGAMMRAEKLNISRQGLQFNLILNNQKETIVSPNIISKSVVYALLAAAAVGVTYDLSLLEIKDAFKGFKPPRGRMNLIEGAEESLIIDDTYNASPQSTFPALETMSSLQANRKVVVFGDMLELGSYSQKGHYEVGKKAAEVKVDLLMTIGSQVKNISKGARENGLKEEKIKVFNSHEEIIHFLKKFLQKEDLVLVKGSQGARMDKVVKGIMSESQRASELLVRQGPEWS